MEAGVETAFGRFGLVADGDAITRLVWSSDAPVATSSVLRIASQQLQAYFAGEIFEFDLPLRPTGGEFQQSVNAAMSAIPYGETQTYGDIAKALGASAQAVGNACGKNSIPVIIPCHRVLGAQGLGGFSGDGAVETKVKLLIHEGAAGLLI
jgi:methylated-DNA-[protein]-cysteine S-methyltransferase